MSSLAIFFLASFTASLIMNIHLIALLSRRAVVCNHKVNFREW